MTTISPLLPSFLPISSSTRHYEVFVHYRNIRTFRWCLMKNLWKLTGLLFADFVHSYLIFSRFLDNDWFDRPVMPCSSPRSDLSFPRTSSHLPHPSSAFWYTKSLLAPLIFICHFTNEILGSNLLREVRLFIRLFDFTLES